MAIGEKLPIARCWCSGGFYWELATGGWQLIFDAD
jgi:hypothetical protein